MLQQNPDRSNQSADLVMSTSAEMQEVTSAGSVLQSNWARYQSFDHRTCPFRSVYLIATP